MHIASKNCTYCNFIAKLIAIFDNYKNEDENISFYTANVANVHKHNRNYDVALILDHFIPELSVSKTTPVIVFTQSNNVFMSFLELTSIF